MPDSRETTMHLNIARRRAPPAAQSALAAAGIHPLLAQIYAPLEEDEAPDAAATDITVATSPHDSRFPATNQSRHCYTKYNEFHRCVAQKGGEEAECEVYRKAYRTLVGRGGGEGRREGWSR